MVISYILMGVEALFWGLIFYVYRSKKMPKWQKWVVALIILIASLIVGAFQSYFRKAAADRIAQATVEKALGVTNSVPSTPESQGYIAAPTLPVTPSTASQKPAPVSPENKEQPEQDVYLYFIQLGAYRTEQEAIHLQQQLDSLGVRTTISLDGTSVSVYRVRMGPFKDLSAARLAADHLKEAGYQNAIIRSPILN